MITRIIWTLLFIGVCIGWLVLSYRPEMLAGREIAFSPSAQPLLIWLFAGSALLFIVIQAVLLLGVRTFPSRIARGGSSPDGGTPKGNDIQIHPAAELFWTALPLVISVLLFSAIWQLSG